MRFRGHGTFAKFVHGSCLPWFTYLWNAIPEIVGLRVEVLHLRDKLCPTWQLKVSQDWILFILDLSIPSCNLNQELL